jgi:hypothetical protein
MSQRYLQAHCQSHTSQLYNLSFVKEPANANPITVFQDVTNAVNNLKNVIK